MVFSDRVSPARLDPDSLALDIMRRGGKHAVLVGGVEDGGPISCYQLTI